MRCLGLATWCLVLCGAGATFSCSSNDSNPGEQDASGHDSSVPTDSGGADTSVPMDSAADTSSDDSSSADSGTDSSSSSVVNGCTTFTDLTAQASPSIA